MNEVDLWVGGLAEKIRPVRRHARLAPSPSSSRTQLENLQNADRFYYLERLDGLNLLAQLEGNSFGELIERNTTAIGLAGSGVLRPDFVFNLDALPRPVRPLTIRPRPASTRR